jgi:hypothetical protein
MFKKDCDDQVEALSGGSSEICFICNADKPCSFKDERGGIVYCTNTISKFDDPATIGNKDSSIESGFTYMKK